MVLLPIAVCIASPADAQWRSPGDTALFAAVRRSSPELAARRAEVQAAAARLRATGFAAPASLSASAEEIPGGADLTRANLRLGLEREFLSGGRREAARALAAADVGAAEAALQLAEQRLDAEAWRAVQRVAGGIRIARRLAAEDSLLTAAETALRARFSVGEARYVDVLRLRTERLHIQADRAEALTGVAVGRRALQTLLGTVGADSLAERLIATAPDPFDSDTLPSPPSLDTLLARSGAARLADAAVERARAARALVAAEQRPRLTAELGIQRFQGENGARVGPTVGGSLSLPGTARRANRAGLAAADAQVAAAEAASASTRAAIGGALLAARDRYEAARVRLALFDAVLLRGARQEREAALAAYGSGDLSLLELIDFERSLSRAEIARVRARTDAADALADLFSAAAAAAGDAGVSHNPTTNDDR